MSKKPYTPEQIQELKNNKFVKNCTEKSIQFTDECRIVVMQQVEKWIWWKEIFRNLWFPGYVINSEIPRYLIKRLRKKLRNNKDDNWLKDERWKHSTWRKIKNIDNEEINDKQVKRIMKKYGLVWKIRKRNPYKDIMKKWIEDQICPNILSRDFNTWRPFEKVWTDITYLYYKWWKCYLSIAN